MAGYGARVSRRFLGLWLLVGWVIRLGAAERTFDFTSVPEGGVPPGWKAVLAGKGKPGEWKVVMADVPPAIVPLTQQAPNITKRAVVAQVSHDPEDERFPLLVFEEERYADFEAQIRFQIVGGGVEQMAGLVFRGQDAGNFYVVRASALGNNLRFYKFVNGERSAPIGPEIAIRKGTWHELGVKCTGNRIEVSLDGKSAMPVLTDNSHAVGWIGFFTKSDSSAYFTDLKLKYRPLETLAQVLVRTTLEKQPRLMDLQVLGKRPGSERLEVMAAKVATEVGRDASETEVKVWDENRAYYAKTRSAAIVTSPLHDRNGEVIGVARFALKPYAGQLESATIARVLPIVRDMEQRIGASQDLME
jgi:hypothetical protein